MTASPERLSEVSRLAGLLADRVLEAQIFSRPIPDQHVKALLDAALLLDRYDIPLPPLLKQIIHEVGKRDEQELAANVIEQDEGKGLAWLLRPFKGKGRNRVD